MHRHVYKIKPFPFTNLLLSALCCLLQHINASHSSWLFIFSSSDYEVKAPDFLPAKQKALFMRINNRSGKKSMDENSPNKAAPSE